MKIALNQQVSKVPLEIENEATRPNAVTPAASTGSTGTAKPTVDSAGTGTSDCGVHESGSAGKQAPGVQSGSVAPIIVSHEAREAAELARMQQSFQFTNPNELANKQRLKPLQRTSEAVVEASLPLQLHIATNELETAHALAKAGKLDGKGLTEAISAVTRAQRAVDAMKRKAARATFNQAIEAHDEGKLDNVVDPSRIVPIPQRPGYYVHADTGQVCSLKFLKPVYKEYRDEHDNVTCVRVRHSLTIPGKKKKKNDYRARLNLAAKLGTWEYETVDHRNGVTTDDRFDNLDAATSQQQADTRGHRQNA